ncbi:hypothetical protein T09_11411 [Trichinella sp. T9]|nr:hypothetical protein T09_11411 [Trichinella sp. T9]
MKSAYDDNQWNAFSDSQYDRIERVIDTANETMKFPGDDDE